MSKPRYWWYGNVVRTIRAYPALMEAKSAMQAQSMTADYSGMPRSGRAARNTEQCALRQLSQREERELDAVRLAIEDIGRQRDGREVLQVVELVDWGNRTLEDAAQRLHMSERTVKARRARFIYAVAKKCGWL